MFERTVMRIIIAVGIRRHPSRSTPNELPPLQDINHYIPDKPMKLWIAHKQALEEDVKAKLQSGILRFTSEIPLAASHMVPKHDSNNP